VIQMVTVCVTLVTMELVVKLVCFVPLLPPFSFSFFFFPLFSLLSMALSCIDLFIFLFLDCDGSVCNGKGSCDSVTGACDCISTATGQYCATCISGYYGSDCSVSMFKCYCSLQCSFYVFVLFVRL
jgi:hypothetical protein